VPDKYKATWVSHSSIADFLKCPRAYYLRHVYKDPVTGHKITEIKPSLAMGAAIHDVLDEISTLPVEERLMESLINKIDKHWLVGKAGGFKTAEEENIYKERAVKMLERVEKNPGPIAKQAVKIKTEDSLLYYWLSEEENIILSGKIDWIEYLLDNTVHIIDFKTGKHEEPEDSLQLPIYQLLAGNTQTRKVAKISYWYLETDNTPREQVLIDLTQAQEKVMEVAKRMKLARQINYFKCPKDGCFVCRPLERIVNGEGIKVGESEYRQDIYYLP
jgi:ATP-dependent helicase/DNAse subunit B